MHKGKSQFALGSPTVCYSDRMTACRREAKIGKSGIFLSLPIRIQHQYYIGNINIERVWDGAGGVRRLGMARLEAVMSTGAALMMLKTGLRYA